MHTKTNHPKTNHPKTNHLKTNHLKTNHILRPFSVSLRRGTIRHGTVFCLILFFLAPGLLAQGGERALGGGDSDPEIFEVVSLPNGEVLLFGTGFEPEPEDNSVYLLGVESGAFLEVLEATPDRLHCRIEPYASALVEAVQLRTGSGFALPAAMHHLEGRSYLADEARWFIAHRATTGPPLKLSEPPGKTVIGSHLEDDKPTLTLGELTTAPCTEIEIRIVVESKLGFGGPILSPPQDRAEEEGEPQESAPQESAPQWLGIAASLHLTFLTAVPKEIAGDTLAADLAFVLNETYGSLGLEATAVDGNLILSHVLGISDGFAQLSY